MILCYNLKIIFLQELSTKFFIYILRGVSYNLSLTQKVMHEMHWTFITMNMNIGWQSRALVSFPFLCHFVQDDMSLTLFIACFRYSDLNLFVTFDQRFSIASPWTSNGPQQMSTSLKTFTNKSNFFLKKKPLSS